MAKITKVSKNLIGKQIKILVFTEKQISARTNVSRGLSWLGKELTPRMGQTFYVGGIDQNDNCLFIHGKVGEHPKIWLKPQWVELLD